VVEDGVSGFLVDSDAEIAPRLAALLEDEEGRLRVSRAALRHSRSFDLEIHVDRIEALYRRLLSRRDRAPGRRTAPS
jgi:glycosyltransferase involved in cell wall biosynthesis